MWINIHKNGLCLCFEIVQCAFTEWDLFCWEVLIFFRFMKLFAWFCGITFYGRIPLFCPWLFWLLFLWKLIAIGGAMFCGPPIPPMPPTLCWLLFISNIFCCWAVKFWFTYGAPPPFWPFYPRFITAKRMEPGTKMLFWPFYPPLGVLIWDWFMKLLVCWTWWGG